MDARSSSVWAALLAVALLAALAPGAAGAATIVNGDFESGTLSGWNVHQETQAGDWFAYQGTSAPIGSKRPTPAAPVQAPPHGLFAAIADEANPDTLILYQDIPLEPGRQHRLSLLAFYNTYKPIAVPTPDTLSVDEEALGGKKNQQFRIDVMKPDAPLESVDPADILQPVFATKPGDPRTMAPTKLTANLSGFAGQTVRLRIAVAAHEEVLNAGVDAVSITTTATSPSSQHGGSKSSGPVLFRVGRARADRHDGTVALRVRVFGSGLVRAAGARASLRAVDRRVGASRPIEPVTVPVAAARTVTLRLRPTPSMRAILRRRHRLRTEVSVSYLPIGGPAEATSVPVVFKLASHPRRRP